MDGMEPVGEISDERWEKVFAVNTTAVMRSMRMATEIFLAQGHGVFVNNISAGGLYGARAGAAYTASKHAVVGLTKIQPLCMLIKIFAVMVLHQEQ